MLLAGSLVVSVLTVSNIKILALNMTLCWFSSMNIWNCELHHTITAILILSSKINAILQQHRTNGGQVLLCSQM